RPPPPADDIDMKSDAKSDTESAAKPDTPAAPAGPPGIDAAIDALTQRVQADLTRQVRAAFDELVSTAQTERERAAAEARQAAQAAAATEVAAAVAAAEEKTRSLEAKPSGADDAAYKAG